MPMLRVEFQHLISRVERLTAKRYPHLRTLVDGAREEQLTRELFEELRRLTIDVEHEVSSAKRSGNRDAWQRGKIY